MSKVDNFNSIINEINLKDMRVGSVVLVDNAVSDTPKVGVVDNILNDVKNEEPGIDYHLKSNSKEKYWAYLDQVIRVIKK